jgi:hypothetical protein
MSDWISGRKRGCGCQAKWNGSDLTNE